MIAPSSDSMDRFVRRDLSGFRGYSARKAPETLTGKTSVPVDKIIKLDANENPYGCSPKVNKALASYSDLSVYPDDEQHGLRKLLASYAGIDASRIVAGSGSNQLIDLLLRLLIDPGDEVINCVPTFGLFQFSTSLCSGKVVEVFRDKNFVVDPRAVKAAITGKTKIIFLVSPNNPTGNIMPVESIREILDTGLPVLVDEAYYEFSGETAVPLLEKYGNLMILRTFSKWAGLAGLRIGYGIFPPDIADWILRIKIPYNVNVAAYVAVEHTLKDINYLMGNVKAIVLERQRLFDALEMTTLLKPFPSRANFILCSVLRGGAVSLKRDLEERGILVRYFDHPLLQDCVRISVGKPEHTDALMSALGDIQAGLATGSG